MANYVKDQKFVDKNNWSDIKRGWIFEAVVPYTSERPLDFFIPDPSDNIKGKLQRGYGNFRPGTTQKAVIELKQRKVLILSSDENCADRLIYDVTVAPIYGIYTEDKNEEWYPKVLNGTHPFFAYLPASITGMECIVDLTNIISISKNMLLKDKYDITTYMDPIEKLLEYCLSLGVYKKKNEETEEVS